MMTHSDYILSFLAAVAITAVTVIGSIAMMPNLTP